jgi:hypothetical protein
MLLLGGLCLVGGWQHLVELPTAECLQDTHMSFNSTHLPVRQHLAVSSLLVAAAAGHVCCRRIGLLLELWTASELIP